MTVCSPSEYLRVTLVVPLSVLVTVVQLPDLGPWMVSPSWISASGTCSVACSELITPPDRRPSSFAVAARSVSRPSRS